ncbi:MAG: hypothetical protein H8E32_09640 [Nitrospinae bacterium]|nr:hypothetical protein [Nitrospinota bacterium]
MIEQYLQVALEFVKEIWFQLDSKFGLEETEAFKFIQPYLLQLQDNPTYMAIAFAVLILLPYGLYKVRSISRERDRKLDELMEEMEEDDEADDEGEYDEDDPRRLRRPELEEAEELDGTILTEADYEDEDDKPLFEKEEDPPYMQILEKLDEEEKEDELHVDTQKVMGTELDEFELEPVSSELAEPDINKDLSEFDGFEFDSEPSNLDDSPHDQAIQELQEEGELMELDSELPADDPFAKYSELDDEEQDRAIQELQDEMESTINKLTEQLESDPETASTMKDLGDIRIGDGATIDDEYILDEEFSEDAKLEEPLLPETSDLALEPKPLSSLDLTDEVKPVVEDIEPVHEETLPLEPIPERNYTFDTKPGQGADSLINRLKYFQENLDTRFHHREKEGTASEPKIDDLVSDPRFVEQRSFAPKAPKVSPVDNKKYMEVLESFIFLKDQNKH